jgi:hypothetical protein
VRRLDAKYSKAVLLDARNKASQADSKLSHTDLDGARVNMAGAAARAHVLL